MQLQLICKSQEGWWCGYWRNIISIYVLVSFLINQFLEHIWLHPFVHYASQTYKSIRAWLPIQLYFVSLMLSSAIYLMELIYKQKNSQLKCNISNAPHPWDKSTRRRYSAIDRGSAQYFCLWTTNKQCKYINRWCTENLLGLFNNKNCEYVIYFD